MDLREKLIEFKNWDDKNSCWLFGDGYENENEARVDAFLNSINLNQTEPEPLTNNKDCADDFVCCDYIEGINMQCARCDQPKYKHRF